MSPLDMSVGIDTVSLCLIVSDKRILLDNYISFDKKMPLARDLLYPDPQKVRSLAI